MYDRYQNTYKPILDLCDKLVIVKGVCELHDKVTKTEDRWVKLKKDIKIQDENCKESLKKIDDCFEQLIPFDELLMEVKKFSPASFSFGDDAEKAKEAKCKVKVLIAKIF